MAKPFNNIREDSGSLDHVFHRDSFIDTVNPFNFFHADQHRTDTVGRNPHTSKKTRVGSREHQRGYGQSVGIVFKVYLFYN